MDAEKTEWLQEHKGLYYHEMQEAQERGYFDDKDFVKEVVSQDTYWVQEDEHGNVQKTREPYLEFASQRVKADKEVVITAVMHNFIALASADPSLRESEDLCRLAALYKKSWDIKGNSTMARFKRRRYQAQADKMGQKMLEQLAKNKAAEAE